MIIFTSALSLISLGVVCGVHIASRLAPGILSKILDVVNVCLHIALIFVLMIEEIPIEESVLCYMISVFVYTLCSFLAHRLHGNKRGVKEEENDL